MNIPPVF